MGKLRFLSFLTTALAVLLLSSGQALAEKRIALVIGIGKYITDSLPPLANPPNDAKLMAATLRDLDFEVLERLDLNQNGIRRAIRDFGSALDKAGEDAVGLFFYAGHGVQVNGSNYLLPVDANIQREGDVEIEAVNASTVLSMMEFSRARINFIIMDSCRNNPLSRSFRSATRGLARMDAPRGTLIAYATAPGDVAADGTGANSPYTLALSKAMKIPGLSVEQMFREVRNQVMASTKDFQVPWESSSLTGADFYFKDGPATMAAPAQPTPQPAAPQQQADIVAWQSIQDSTNPEEIEAFILAFRDSPFVGMARAKLKALKKQQVAVVVPPPQPTPPPSQVKPAVGVYPGDMFRDCAECPEMVVIPAGSFRMGDLSGVNEKPVHNVRIPRPFAVGKYEVTFAEWDSCVAAGGCSHRSDDKSWGRGNRPVISVNWNDARAYVRWLSHKAGKQYHLLSESEWEYMARSGSTSKYPFGNSEGSLCIHGNGADTSTGYDWRNKLCRDGYGKQTAPVGSFQPNSFGVYDTVGNVWEWVEDCWHGSYAGAPGDGVAWTSDGDCSKRVLRGGSWINEPWNLRSTYRHRNTIDYRYNSIGFRVARTL